MPDPLEGFFNKVGKGPLASNPAFKAPKPRAPKGPTGLGLKIRAPARAPGKEIVVGRGPKGLGAPQARVVAPKFQPYKPPPPSRWTAPPMPKFSPWPAPFLKPSLQFPAAAAPLAKLGPTVAGFAAAQAAGAKQMRGLEAAAQQRQFAATHWKDAFGIWHDTGRGGWETLGGALPMTLKQLGESWIKGTPLEPFVAIAQHPTSPNAAVAQHIEDTIGPIARRMYEKGAFNPAVQHPWETGLEAAGLIPGLPEVRGLGEGARALAEGARLAEEPFHARAVMSSIAKNLKLRINPANLEKGLAVNEAVREPNGVVSYGKIGFPDWVRRTRTNLVDNKTIGAWKNWYRDAKPVFHDLFGTDAEAAMRGFAVSQANTSPAGGLRVVLRVLDDIRHGRPTTNEGIGMVAQTVRQAIEHGYVDSGVAQKLSDFTDNLYGRTTRTWMGGAPEGGYPVAGDIHAARDVGYVDKKLVNRIQQKHPGAQPVIDLKGGSPNATQYEQIQRFYQDLTNHLNRYGFAGHRDWTPEEAQAVGWASIQKHWGASPETWERGIIAPNTYRIAAEVSPGEGTPFAQHYPQLGDHSIPYSRGLRITHQVIQETAPKMIQEEGGVLRHIHYGPGGYQHTITPSAHLDVVASPEQVQRIIDKMAGAYDQHGVLGLRVVHGKGSKMTFLLESPDFVNADKMSMFWRRVQQLASPAQLKHLQGFAPAGDTMTIISDRGYSPIAGVAAKNFRNRFEPLFEQAAKDTGVNINGYHVTNLEVKEGTRGAAAAPERPSAAPGGDNLDLHRAAVAESLDRAYAQHAPGELAAFREHQGAQRGGPLQALASLGPHLAGVLPAVMHAGTPRDIVTGLAGTTLASAAKGAREAERVVELPGGRELITGASPSLAGALERGQARNVQAVMEASRAAGLPKGMELEGSGTFLGGVRARLAQAHLARITRDAFFYDRTGLEAEAKWLEELRLSSERDAALRAVADGVHPDVTIAANERRIADAQRQLETLPAKIDAAEKAGDTSEATHLRLRLSDAQHAVKTLPGRNEALAGARDLVHNVPVEEIDRTRYPVYAGAAGTKPILNETGDRASTFLNSVWDSMVRQGHLARDAEIRAGNLTPAQAENRVHMNGRLDLGAARTRGESSLPTTHQDALNDVRKLQGQLSESMAQDAKKVAPGSMPGQPIGFEGQRFMSNKSRSLRLALNRAEDRLTKIETGFQNREGFHPSELYGTRTRISGAEDFKNGSLYYPGADELALSKPAYRGPRKSASILPYEGQSRPQKAYTGYLRETGRDSYKVANLVGRTARTRLVREHFNQTLAELRGAATEGIPLKGGKLHPDYIAIREAKSVPPEITREHDRALAEIEGKGGETTPEDAVRLANSFRKVRDWLLPEVKTLEGARALEGQVGYVHKSLASALADETWQTPEQLRRLSTAARNASTLTRDMLIATKFPGHITSRLASNTIMPLFDSGTDLGKAMLWNQRLIRDDPSLRDWMHQAMGSGYTKAYTGVTGVSKGVHTFSRKVMFPIERVADREPRLAALGATMIKRGEIKDYAEYQDYIKRMRAASPGSRDALDRRLNLEAGRKAAGEYENLRPWQHALANYLFVTRWLVASTRWAGRTVLRHPLKSAAVGALTAQYGYQAANPIWNRFNIAGHNVQTATPWSTDYEIGNRVWDTLLSGGNKAPQLGGSLLSMMDPTWLALANMASKRDLETGRDIKGNAVIGALHALVRQFPIVSTAFGRGPFWSYRLPRELLGNWAPVTGPAGPVGGGGGPSLGPTPVLTGGGGGGFGGPIGTPAQQARMRAAQGRLTNPAAEQRMRAAQQRLNRRFGR